MIFENETIGFVILDVIRLNQKNINGFNTERNFDALSFRYKAETVLKNNTNEYKVNDNSICFVPARTDYTRISKDDNLIVIHFNSLSYSSKQIECFYPKNAKKLAELFNLILEKWEQKSVGYKHKCSAVLCEIFSEIYSENVKEFVCNPIIKNSVKYIKENFLSPNISIKDVAEKSFISEVYFRKMFKKEFGISPKKHIINLRIQYAKGLMTTGYYSLKEISEMCGFTDYKYFSVEFKRIVTVSPSKYLYNYSNNKSKHI